MDLQREIGIALTEKKKKLNSLQTGEGKRWNEFAEWHVAMAWLAE